MTNTQHYNMTIAEGTDVVNPLTQIFPNFNTIDGAMFANKQAGIGTASEVTTGTVHAIIRANPDSNVFRFTATSAWTAGDTMTLDGNAVVVHMSDGTVPATGAYIIGAEVLAMVNAGLVTLAISSNGGVTSFNTRTGNVMPEASDYTASDIDFDNTNTTLTATDVQGAIEEVSASVAATSVEYVDYTIPSRTYTNVSYTNIEASKVGFGLNENAKIVSATVLGNNSNLLCISVNDFESSKYLRLRILNVAGTDLTQSLPIRIWYKM